MKREVPAPVEPLAISVDYFIKHCYPVCRDTAVKLMRSGALPSFRHGNRRLILYKEAVAFVHRMAEINAEVTADEAFRKARAGAAGAAGLARRRAAKADASDTETSDTYPDGPKAAA